MKVKDCMAGHVVSIGAGEPIVAAARVMARYNLGMLPVTGKDGRVKGVVTDRDLVLRCMAAGLEREDAVERVMSNFQLAVDPEDAVEKAARMMARERVRRLMVVKEGKVIGMISLGDLARQSGYAMEAGMCLGAVCSAVRRAEREEMF